MNKKTSKPPSDNPPITAEDTVAEDLTWNDENHRGYFHGR